MMEGRMKLLATLRPEDVEPGAAPGDYHAFVLRQASRAIVFDGDKVALIHVSKRGYYMLPGGGIEDEDAPSALAREILEEVGCEVAIGPAVGRIDVYFDRWQQKQTDYCYTAQKAGGDRPTSLIAFEEAEGFKTVWASDLDTAITLVRQAAPAERDGKLVRARDLLFLEHCPRK